MKSLRRIKSIPSTLMLGLVIALSVTRLSRADSWIFDMSVAPEQASSGWWFDGSTALRSNANGLMRINDDGFGFLQYRYSLAGSNRTLEARVRILSSDPQGSFGCGYLGFLATWPFDGTYIYFETNRLCLSDCHGHLSCTNIDFFNSFRIVRLTQDPVITRVFVDGTEVAAVNQCGNDANVSFGAASIPARGDSTWDYVAFTDSGAWKPADFSFFTPVLSITRQGAMVTLCWESFPHLQYQLETCTNLTIPKWIVLGDAFPGTGAPTCRAQLVVPTNDFQVFWRISTNPLR